MRGEAERFVARVVGGADRGDVGVEVPNGGEKLLDGAKSEVESGCVRVDEISECELGPIGGRRSPRIESRTAS